MVEVPMTCPGPGSGDRVLFGAGRRWGESVTGVLLAEVLLCGTPEKRD